MPEDIALFIDFENIRYSMLNIQRREPDPQELIAVARRYGTVMVARAYADWSRQPEPFKGSLTAAMIDRVDCPAKQRDRVRTGTIHYTGNPATGGLSATGYVTEQGYPSGPYQRPWANGITGHSGPLPAISPQQANQDWGYQDAQSELDESLLPSDEGRGTAESGQEQYGVDYQQRETPRQGLPYQSSYGQPPSGPLGQSNTGPLGYPGAPAGQHTGNTGHLPAVNASGTSTIVQSTVVQSTVDLNMLMDIIETVFDRPTISTFVLMTGDKDFTRISARLKLRLNKTVIVVGIPGTVSRDLISSASQFVPLVSGGAGISTGNTGALPAINGGYSQASSGNTGSMPAISYGTPGQQYQSYNTPPMDVLDPQFLQFLDYIDRNWSWRTIIGVSNFIGDPVNPKNRFRGRLTRESARELLNACIQQNILLVQTDASGAEDLRLNRAPTDSRKFLHTFKEFFSMDESRIAFFRRMIAAPGPSGFEQPVQQVIREEIRHYTDEARTDVHGNVIAALNASGGPRVMLEAHCDELGFLVRYIDEHGFIYFAPIGGFDPSTLPGERVQIHTANGPVLGVIGRKPAHLLRGEEREKTPKLSELWIDIGVADKEEAQKLVALGDVATRAAQLEPMRDDLVVSRALDDRSGVFAITEAMRRIHEQRDKLKAAVYFVSAVQEEVGLRGARTAAYEVNPRIAIAVDVTFTSDHPGVSAKEIGEVKLNGGPVLSLGGNINPRVYQLLRKAADEAGISCQISPEPSGTGTDTDVIQVVRGGVATGLVCIPCRYLHTGSEMASLKDIDQVAEVIARFVLALNENTNVIP